MRYSKVSQMTENDNEFIQTIEAMPTATALWSLRPCKARAAGGGPINDQEDGYLAENHGSDCGTASYINTMSRYAAIKEEEAQKCKDELLPLTDYRASTFETIPTYMIHSGRLQPARHAKSKLRAACSELMDAVGINPPCSGVPRP